MRWQDLIEQTNALFNDSPVDLEKILKRKYKVWIPTMVILFIIAALIIVIGIIDGNEIGYVTSVRTGRFYKSPIADLISGIIILLGAICVTIIVLKKMKTIQRFIAGHNITEINRSLNSNFNTDNIYPKMSLYVTEKLIISTKQITSVCIEDIQGIWISARETSTALINGSIDMVGIRVRTRSGSLKTLYETKNTMNNTYRTENIWGETNYRQGLTDEMVQFARKIKRDFPDIEIFSDLDF